MHKPLFVFIIFTGLIANYCSAQRSNKANTVKFIAHPSARYSGAQIQQYGYNVSLNGEKCGTGIIHRHLMATDPVYKSNYEQEQKNIQKTISEWQSGAKTPPPVYTVPLVFHVIHKGEAVGSGTNISDAQIQSAVEALNRDYRRTNADGGIAQGNGPDTEIQFCLASKDPQGNPTSGIKRVNGTSVSGYSSSGITSSNETQVKALSKWPNDDYVNIWVVSEIEDNDADVANTNNFTGGTMGYAYLPPAPASVDGIVAVNLAIGNDPQDNKGYRLWAATLTNRVLTHEMGHVLGLNHTFDDGNPTSCTDGDGISDTPPAKLAQGITSCSNPVAQGACSNQNIAIYMDYTPEICQNMFSQGETNAMRATLAGTRNSLTISSNTNCTSCTAATVTISSTNPTCTSNTGTATANPAGGTTPYTYSWSNGGTSQTISGLAAGTYSVTVTAAGGCTTTKSVSLAAPGTPSATANGVNATSASSCDGTASVSASGGTSPYTYSWSNGATVSNISSLCTGNYTVTVTGSDGCKTITTVTISAPLPPGCDTLFNVGEQDTLVIYGLSQANNCNGSGWGYISGHNCYGDKAKADFFNAASGDNISSAVLYFAKAYSGSASSAIAVKIWNGYSGTPGAELGSVTVPINQITTTAPLVVNFSPAVTVSGNFFCGIQLSANGTPQDTVALATNADGNTMPGTAWEMWSDNTWHHDSAAWGINIANAIGVIKCTTDTAQSCTLTATATSTNTACGQSNGSATVSASGGTSSYSYGWSNGGTTSTITGISAGIYTVTVTSGGCTKTISVTVDNNIFVSSSATNATCNQSNGSATLTVTGGTSPYTYSWNTTPVQTNATATGLPGGSYTGIITDASGCKDTVTVTVNNTGGVNANITESTSICEGNSKTIIASGGTSYQWSSGQTTGSISVSPASTTTYFVTVSDNSGCTDTASTTITVNPIPVTTVSATDDTVCTGTAVTLSASGGTSYFWNFTSQTTASVTVYPTSSTTYTVMALNGNCTGNAVSVKVNIFLPAPDAVASSDVSVTYISQGGTVNFSSAGSTGTAYGWDFTGNGSVDATTASATHNYTASGTYTVILSAAFGGCTDYDTLIITVMNQPPPAGIIDNEEADRIKIFPNPGDGKFRISSAGSALSRIEVFNILGEKVFEENLFSMQGVLNFEIALPLPSGIYYVTLQYGPRAVTRKITLIRN